MKRFRFIAWIAMGILAAALFFRVFSYAVVTVRKGSVQSARARISELKKRQSDIEEAVDQKEAWERVPAELERFHQKSIPSFDEFSTFRDQLQKRISGSGLTTLKFTYRMRPVQIQLQRVTLEFSLTGPYAAIKRFVYQTEGQKKMVFLKSIQMRKSREGIIANFTMEAFFGR